MDDIDAFFNRNKPFARKQISGGTTNGRIKIETPRKPARSDDFANTSKYAEQHVAENQQQLLDVSFFFVCVFSSFFFSLPCSVAVVLFIFYTCKFQF